MKDVPHGCLSRLPTATKNRGGTEEYGDRIGCGTGIDLWDRADRAGRRGECGGNQTD
jgi:hypothetical protein